MNEFELIRKYFDRPARSALVGVGDDCALLPPVTGALAVTTDLLVEGTHFSPGADPRLLGHKTLAVNLSDLAAMGATPKWATLSASLVKIDEAWVAAFAQGLFALADRFGVEVVGGDTTRGPVLTLSVTAMGDVPSDLALTRAGASPGDDIWVSGELGGAALALKHPEVEEAARRLHAPEPRVELGERLRGIAHAAIDVSDGLAGDLGHILERSQLGAVVHYKDVPKAKFFEKFQDLEKDCVLSGGDDYELIFIAPQVKRTELEKLSNELKLRLTRIGSMQPGPAKLAVLDAAGKPMTFRGGFDHFA